MKIKLSWRKEWTPLAIVGGSSLLVGAGIGYGIGYVRGKRKMHDHDMDVVEHVKAPPIIKEVRVFEVEPEDVEPQPEPKEEIRHNIFHREEDDWDYEKEVENRIPGEPYIIHQDEFFEEKDDDLHQDTLTYYAGDDVLFDESDGKPIYNAHQVIGRDNLRFGHGSMDPNIVYIRNEKLEIEYEVIRHSGHYAVEVMGEEMGEQLAKTDLKHSVLRFRQVE